MATLPTVFLSLPTGNRQLDYGAALAALCLATEGKCRVIPAPSMNSLRCHGFNGAWCEALNRREENGITHFAMLHDDVIPERFWLDRLMEELPPGGMVSAVVAIKSDWGLTSTAIDVREGDDLTMPRRLTLKEVHELPETFTAADVGYPGKALLVNTGCWLCGLRQPWVELVHFEEINFIVKQTSTGKFHPVADPEDWNFSRQLHKLGVPVVATRKIRVNHCGSFLFGNDTVWGTWDTDAVFAKNQAALVEV